MSKSVSPLGRARGVSLCTALSAGAGETCPNHGVVSAISSAFPLDLRSRHLSPVKHRYLPPVQHVGVLHTRVCSRGCCWEPEGMAVLLNPCEKSIPSSHFIVTHRVPSPKELDSKAMRRQVFKNGDQVCWMQKAPSRANIKQNARLAVAGRQLCVCCSDAWSVSRDAQLGTAGRPGEGTHCL